MASAAPSKRSRLNPAGSRTGRVSLIRAKPPSALREIDPELRKGARYTVTERSDGIEARVSAAVAGVAASAQAGVASAKVSANLDAGSRRIECRPRLVAPRIRRLISCVEGGRQRGLAVGGHGHGPLGRFGAAPGALLTLCPDARIAPHTLF